MPWVNLWPRRLLFLKIRHLTLSLKKSILTFMFYQIDKDIHTCIWEQLTFSFLLKMDTGHWGFRKMNTEHCPFFLYYNQCSFLSKSIRAFKILTPLIHPVFFFNFINLSRHHEIDIDTLWPTHQSNRQIIVNFTLVYITIGECQTVNRHNTVTDAQGCISIPRPTKIKNPSIRD